MTFWTLILQGFLISPLHTLMYSYGLLQRHRSGPLTWDIWVSVSILCLLVGQEGYAMIHSVCTCLYVCTLYVYTALLSKSISFLTFSGCSMTEWSSRSSLHLPQLLSVVTFHQTPGIQAALILLSLCLFKRQVGQVDKKGGILSRVHGQYCYQ